MYMYVFMSLQAGYLESILMLFLGYTVVVLTVLSISAIATNGNVEGGGVYCILKFSTSMVRLATMHVHVHLYTILYM